MVLFDCSACSILLSSYSECRDVVTDVTLIVRAIIVFFKLLSQCVCYLVLSSWRFIVSKSNSLTRNLQWINLLSHYLMSRIDWKSWWSILMMNGVLLGTDVSAAQPKSRQELLFGRYCTVFLLCNTSKTRSRTLPLPYPPPLVVRHSPIGCYKRCWKWYLVS